MMLRGVKKLVNSSDVLCINGMDASNSSANSSTTLFNSSGLGNVCRFGRRRESRAEGREPGNGADGDDGSAKLWR